MQSIKRFWMEEDGAEVGEWALFFSLIAIVALASVTVLKTDFVSAFTALGEKVYAQASNVGPISQ